MGDETFSQEFVRQNVALRDDLAKDRGKTSQSGTNESHDDVSTSLKVKTKTIRVLLDTGSSGDLLFMQKGKIDIPIVNLCQHLANTL